MRKLYSGPLSMFGAKVQIALLEKGLDFELTMVPFDRDDRYEPTSLCSVPRRYGGIAA